MADTFKRAYKVKEDGQLHERLFVVLPGVGTRIAHLVPDGTVGVLGWVVFSTREQAAQHFAAELGQPG